MECNKLLGEAFQIIEMKYKMPDALRKIYGDGTKSMKARSLKKRLIDSGIKTSELKATGIWDYLDSKGIEKVNIRDVYSNISTMGRRDLGNQFDSFTDNRAGIDNDTYKETGFTVPDGKEIYKPHFSDVGDTLIGWLRTTDDGKAVMLHEFQSDWAQTERSGRGVFAKNVGKKLKGWVRDGGVVARFNRYFKDNQPKMSDAEIDTMDKAIRYVDIVDEVQVNMDELYRILPDETVDGFLKNYRPHVVPDFDMGDDAFNKLMIVDGLNEAIDRGLDTVRIPINREGPLAGTKGVTKFYRDLDKKILPSIREKLSKQGMKIEHKVVKGEIDGMGYESAVTDNDLDFIYDGLDHFDTRGFGEIVDKHRDLAPDDILAIDEYIRANYGQQYTFQARSGERSFYGDLTIDDADSVYEAIEADGMITDALSNRIEGLPNQSLEELDYFITQEYGPKYTMLNQYRQLLAGDRKIKKVPQEYHEIKLISQGKNAPRWDIFGLVGALGLTEEYERMKDER